MYLKKHIFYLMAVVFVLYAFSPIATSSTWEDASKDELSNAVNKAANWFVNNKKYKVKVAYTTFLNHTTSVAHERSIGYFKRDNNYFNTTAMSINTIQNEKMQLVVDSINELIILNNKTDFNQSPFDSKGFLKLLENVKSIKKQKNENGAISYKVEFNPNKLYSQYEITLNTIGEFQSVKYYYSEELSRDEDDGSVTKGKPRLEIVYSDYSTNVNFDYDKEFSEKKYFKEINGKVVLNDSFKKYELKDYRFTQKK